MCRSCSETSNGQGRRCERSDGFTSTEGEQRSRSRGLNNAAVALADGDPQAAVNQLENARRAQMALDGGTPVTGDTPSPTGGAHRDFIVAPNDLDFATMQLTNINRERAAHGRAPLAVETTRQAKRSESDPIMVWERNVVRVSGATDDELSKLALGKVSSDAERRVDTSALMHATQAIMRVESDGKYVSRAEGGDRSTPALLQQYLADAPGGALRGRYEPTIADKRRGSTVRLMAKNGKATSDYETAMVAAHSGETVSVRDAGVAASAVAWVQRRQDAFEAGKAPGGPPEAAQAPSASGTAASVASGRSHWLSSPDSWLTVTGRIEHVEPLYYEGQQGNYLYVLRTPGGDSVKWIALKDEHLFAGGDVTLVGRVKAHSTFRGEKQTVVNHASTKPMGFGTAV